MDEQNPALPKNPWNDDSPVNTKKQWSPMVSKWCEVDFVRPQLEGGEPSKTGSFDPQGIERVLLSRETICFCRKFRTRRGGKSIARLNRPCCSSASVCFIEFPLPTSKHMAVGQNQWYHFGVGHHPFESLLVGIGMFTGGTGL